MQQGSRRKPSVTARFSPIAAKRSHRRTRPSAPAHRPPGLLNSRDLTGQDPAGPGIGGFAGAAQALGTSCHQTVELGPWKPKMASPSPPRLYEEAPPWRTKGGVARWDDPRWHALTNGRRPGGSPQRQPRKNTAGSDSPTHRGGHWRWRLLMLDDGKVPPNAAPAGGKK